jgi:hypothetical protein
MIFVASGTALTIAGAIIWARGAAQRRQRVAFDPLRGALVFY